MVVVSLNCSVSSLCHQQLMGEAYVFGYAIQPSVCALSVCLLTPVKHNAISLHLLEGFQ